MTFDTAAIRRHLHGFWPLMVAVGLTFVFWSELWNGGGLIGGDTYTYFFPQKVYFAERLAAGEFPLWNPLVGHGYPLVAESQTGAFYPFNLVCYSLLDVNTAYNFVQLSHYVLAFLFTWLFARRCGLSQCAALLGGLVFTYGWFPYRISLEWAIVTGAWLPAALWSVESFLQTRQWRYAATLAVVLALQMLAGHFNLAFITQLVLVIYVPGRLWLAKRKSDPPASRPKALLFCTVGMLFGFALAAAQLLPTWELKQASQRASVSTEHKPGYGHTPVWYWSQAVAPWIWYGTGIDINKRLGKDAAGTNDIEAHLYFGLIPLVLVAAGIVVFRIAFLREHWLLLLIGTAALLYTPGWFLPVTQHLPGFSFFMGPGRYSIVTTFAVAVVAAAAFDRLTETSRFTMRGFLFVCVFAGTTADLWCVAWQVRLYNVVIVSHPTLQFIEESEVRKILRAEDRPVRLFCRGPNLPTLLGVASTPPYLGIGPAEYYDPKTALPGKPPFDDPPTREQIEWLRKAGVTHVLSFSLLEDPPWPVTLVWRERDKFLNRAWHRRKPLYLYELRGTRGRVFWAKGGDGGSLRQEEAGANFVRIAASSKNGGRVVLTELSYPGWEATVDGEPAAAHVFEGMYRAVDVPGGRHTIVWRYRPRSILIGLIISIVAAVILTAIALLRYWHPPAKNS